MGQAAIGWIDTGALSIGLLCDPALTGRLSIVTNEPTDTTNLKHVRVQGHTTQAIRILTVSCW